MKEPALLPSAEPAKRDALWEKAPAWRNLSVIASMLTLAVVALPILLPAEDGSAPKSAVAPADAGVAPSPPVPQAMPVSPPALFAPQTPGKAAPPIGQSPTPIIPRGYSVDGPPSALAAPLLTPATPQPPAEASSLPTPGAPLPAIVPETAENPAVSACALRQTATAPRLIGMGTIIGFEDRAASLARIPVTESLSGGEIDPDYIDNVRVIVRRNNGQNTVFIVPKGMVVHLGDRVTLQDSYRNMALPCNYVPIQIASDIGPAPAQLLTTPPAAEPQTVLTPAEPQTASPQQ